MDWFDLVVQRTLKSLLKHHSSKASIFQCSAFFMVQLLHLNMITGKTLALTIWVFVGKWCIYFLFILFFNLKIMYWFTIYQNESATGILVFPTLNPPPSSLPIPSLWVVPVPASSILHWTWTGDSFHIWYYTCYNVILPNHPTLSLSHRVQKTVYTSVSLLLSRIQGYC